MYTQNVSKNIQAAFIIFILKLFCFLSLLGFMFCLIGAWFGAGALFNIVSSMNFSILGKSGLSNILAFFSNFPIFSLESDLVWLLQGFRG